MVRFSVAFNSRVCSKQCEDMLLAFDDCKSLKFRYFTHQNLTILYALWTDHVYLRDYELHYDCLILFDSGSPFLHPKHASHGQWHSVLPSHQQQFAPGRLQVLTLAQVWATNLDVDATIPKSCFSGPSVPLQWLWMVTWLWNDDLESPEMCSVLWWTGVSKKVEIGTLDPMG